MCGVFFLLRMALVLIFFSPLCLFSSFLCLVVLFDEWKCEINEHKVDIKQDLSEISHPKIRLSYGEINVRISFEMRLSFNPRINDYKISAISSYAMLKIAVNNKDEWLCKKWWEAAASVKPMIFFFFSIYLFSYVPHATSSIPHTFSVIYSQLNVIVFTALPFSL